MGISGGGSTNGPIRSEKTGRILPGWRLPVRAGAEHQKFCILLGPARSGKGIFAKLLDGITSTSTFSANRLGDKFAWQDGPTANLAIDGDQRSAVNTKERKLFF